MCRQKTIKPNKHPKQIRKTPPDLSVPPSSICRRPAFSLSRGFARSYMTADIAHIQTYIPTPSALLPLFIPPPAHPPLACPASPLPRPLIRLLLAIYTSSGLPARCLPLPLPFVPALTTRDYQTHIYILSLLPLAQMPVYRSSPHLLPLPPSASLVALPYRASLPCTFLHFPHHTTQLSLPPSSPSFLPPLSSPRAARFRSFSSPAAFHPPPSPLRPSFRCFPPFPAPFDQTHTT